MMVSLVPTVGFSVYLQYGGRIQPTQIPTYCEASNGYMPSLFFFSFDTMQYKLLTASLIKIVTISTFNLGALLNGHGMTVFTRMRVTSTNCQY
jgi:hypothetical protein